MKNLCLIGWLEWNSRLRWRWSDSQIGKDNFSIEKPFLNSWVLPCKCPAEEKAHNRRRYRSWCWSEITSGPRTLVQSHCSPQHRHPVPDPISSSERAPAVYKAAKRAGGGPTSPAPCD